VPNGREVGTPPFADKLGFLDAIEVRVAALAAAGTPFALLGDFNVCPADADVYDPAAFVGATHVTVQERRRLEAIIAAGAVDAYRARHPDEPMFTWWDYRQGHFHRGMGLRIDLALLSPDLAQRTTEVAIVRDYRKGTKPSDHVPMVVEVEVEVEVEAEVTDCLAGLLREQVDCFLSGFKVCSLIPMDLCPIPLTLLMELPSPKLISQWAVLGILEG